MADRLPAVCLEALFVNDQRPIGGKYRSATPEVLRSKKAD
jgi:hypothetical protein